ncbi:MAG TPA: type I-B CRISPR-associated protein Cas5 [Ruminiclostridium sp.]|jgi:CRISPR-associated protein Cas5h|nr:type I-B CRISPR-associated protein Cas5 [Ruminiclostridium sp.]
MYEAIKFRLSGKNGFFKKPDVNAVVYYTYNNIHKVALLGLLGAIIGLKGLHNYKLFEEEPREYPEYYEMLQRLSVSIIPLAPHGYFSKKIQYFNNSVGYASKEAGGNLQVFEQWLEEPDWMIFLKNDGIDDELWNKLIENLTLEKCTYIPYLGKNDFPATILDAQIVQLQPKQADFIDSLFIGELDMLKDEDTKDDKAAFVFTEYSPTGMQPKYNFYTYSRTIYTNCMVENAPDTFNFEDLILAFN